MSERIDASATTAWTSTEPTTLGTPLTMTVVPPPPPPLPAHKKSRKVTPALEPEDESDDEDGEVDETFLALQKLLLNLEGMRLSQVAPPVSAAQQPSQAGVGTTVSSGTLQPQRPSSSDEILESRRQEREQYRLLLLSTASRSTAGASSTRRRRPSHFYCADDDDEEDESRAPSVESTISNRMMNGSFSRYSVHAISRERWAREETERLPVVLLPKNGKVVSPADNPRLNVMHTAEYIDLSEQLEAKLQDELHSRVGYLTPPRSTWSIQMRDFEALHC